MKKSLQMLAVLAGISLASGASLGGLFAATAERAENNVLRFKKIPAVVSIQETLQGALAEDARVALEEALLAGRRTVPTGNAEEILLFVVERDGEPYAVALESAGQGFGGKLGVMVGVTLDTGEVAGIGITTMSETPGVGTRVTESSFTAQFEGLPGDTPFRVKKDGGTLDSISGATISCRAVAAGVQGAADLWAQHESAIRAALAAGPADPAAPGGAS